MYNYISSIHSNLAHHQWIYRIYVYMYFARPNVTPKVRCAIAWSVSRRCARPYAACAGWFRQYLGYMAAVATPHMLLLLRARFMKPASPQPMPQLQHDIYSHIHFTPALSLKADDKSATSFWYQSAVFVLTSLYISWREHRNTAMGNTNWCNIVVLRKFKFAPTLAKC